MGLTSHISDAYDTFSSYPVSFSLISSVTKMSLMMSLMMMVLSLGLTLNLVYLFCAHFLKFLLIVFVDCHVTESQNTFVMSVEYFQSEYFLHKNVSSFKFRILNMITVCCCFFHYFKTMARREPVAVQVLPLHTVQRPCSSRGGEGGVWFIHCIEGQEPKFMNFVPSLRTKLARSTRLLGSICVTISPGRLFTPIF